MTTRSRLTCFAALSTTFALGCAHKAQMKSAPLPTAAAPPPAVSEAKPVIEATPAPVSPDLGASQDLIAQCKLAVDHQTQAPKFAFDQFDLMPQDRDVLEQVAQCLTSGSLVGRSLRLVGRADPRGTDEYNLGLGTRRAHTVASYLEQLGVRAAQLGETTRGALDATGTDAASFQADRRVDLDLAN